RRSSDLPGGEVSDGSQPERREGPRRPGRHRLADQAGMVPALVEQGDPVEHEHVRAADQERDAGRARSRTTGRRTARGSSPAGRGTRPRTSATGAAMDHLDLSYVLPLLSDAPRADLVPYLAWLAP